MRVQAKRTCQIGARKSVPIVGIALTAAELKKIPRGQKFPYSKPRRNVIENIANLLTGAGAEPGAQPPRLYQCPIGHEDVTVPVVSACSMGPARYVAVECINKHWARYPCRA
jgi:hypothetical protein